MYNVTQGYKANSVHVFIGQKSICGNQILFHSKDLI